ncbi:unnamed protein product [Symbiodinium microadriaticum]|nr:unnamed protein product [Symbiodinium microadriaticum]
MMVVGTVGPGTRRRGSGTTRSQVLALGGRIRSQVLALGAVAGLSRLLSLRLRLPSGVPVGPKQQRARLARRQRPKGARAKGVAVERARTTAVRARHQRDGRRTTLACWPPKRHNAEAEDRGKRLLADCSRLFREKTDVQIQLDNARKVFKKECVDRRKENDEAKSLLKTAREQNDAVKRDFDKFKVYMDGKVEQAEKKAKEAKAEKEEAVAAERAEKVGLKLNHRLSPNLIHVIPFKGSIRV